MELVEVNRLDAQRPQRGLKLLADTRRREIQGSVQEAVEVVAKLCGHNPAGTVVAAEVVADQALGKVVPIAFGGVYEIDAKFGGLIEDGIHFGLGESATPLAPKLPGAEANHGHTQAGAAENSIVHGRRLPHNRKYETPIRSET